MRIGFGFGLSDLPADQQYRRTGSPSGCLAAVDHDPLRLAMAHECLAQKPLGGSEIAPFAEPELDCVAIAVDGTVQVRPT